MTYLSDFGDISFIKLRVLNDCLEVDGVSSVIHCN